MKSSPYAFSFLAGVLSAALYLLVIASGVGIPLLALPSLPLFLLGLSHPPRLLMIAILIGAVLALLAGEFVHAAVYIAFIGIPALLFAPAAILPARRAGGGFAWRAIGPLLVDLTIYGTLLMIALVVFYAEQGGLKPLIAESFKTGVADLDPAMQMEAEALSGNLAFLVFSVSAWWWIILLYLHACLANWILANRQRHIRPSLALQRFQPPVALLVALIAAGLCSLASNELVDFAGKTAFILLLLPYFMLGMAIIQEKLRAWPSHGTLLFMLYFFALVLLWPALFIAALGLWQYCKGLWAPRNEV